MKLQPPQAGKKPTLLNPTYAGELVKVVNGLWDMKFVPTELVETTRAEDGGSITHTIKAETVPMVSGQGYVGWYTVAAAPNPSGDTESAKTAILDALGIGSNEGQVVAIAHVYDAEINNFVLQEVYVTPVLEE